MDKEKIKPFVWLGLGIPVLLAPHPWSLAISTIWLSVVFDSIYKQATQPKQTQQTAGWRR
jgi:hypothetical protein